MSDGNTNSQKISGSTKIPIGDMAKSMLHEIFPHLTKDQIEAMKAGKPVPPSPNWIGTSNLSVAVPVSTEGDQARIQELNQKVEQQAALLKEKVRLEGVLDAVVDSMKGGPVVSAIMLFGDKNRMRRARKAVNQFVAQSYPNKQLVIVNATDTPVTTHSHKAIKEVRMEVSADTPTESLGMMRNFGLGLCDGSVIFPHWDDDDVYDRHLLAFLVQNYAFKNYTENGTHSPRAVALSAELRLDIVNSVGYEHKEPDGIPGSMLVPASAARYPDQHGGEDKAFWTRFWSMKSVPCGGEWPVNTLRMCVYDGNNATSIEQFMLGCAGKEFEGRMLMDVKALDHMRAVMSGFGVNTEARQPNVPAAELPQG